MYAYHNKDACRYWREGHAALLNKDFETARDNLEKAKSSFFNDVNNFAELFQSPFVHNIACYFKVTLEIGFLLNQKGNHIGAISYYEESLEYARKVYQHYSDALFLALALNGLGYSSFCLSRFPTAFAYFSELLPLAEKRNSTFDKGYFLILQAACLMRMNKDTDAIDKLNAASSILQSRFPAGQTPLLSGKDFLVSIQSNGELEKMWLMFTDDLTNIAYKEAIGAV